MINSLHKITHKGAKVKVSGRCVMSGVFYETEWFLESNLHKWLGGDLIQNAIPELNDDDREFLISSIAPREFDKLTKDEEDDGDYVNGNLRRIAKHGSGRRVR